MTLFLPSKNELNLLYTNLYQHGVGTFSTGLYWSSSEYTLTGYPSKFAWDQSLPDRTQSNNRSKAGTFRVRSIRVF